jgi:hypothetical protein
LEIRRLAKPTKADPLLLKVREAIQTRNFDPKTLGPYTQYMDEIVLDNDVLVRRTSNARGSQRVLVTQDMGMQLMPQLHDSIFAGHLGLKRTLQRARDRLFWPGMTKGITDYVRQCHVCHSSKSPIPTLKAPLVQENVTSRPFERIAFDVVGPLPPTAKNNKYILVVQDYFSKWAEAYPLPHQKATLVASTLVNEWISRYGAPERMHSDQGSNFESNLMKELAELMDIEKTRTTPYHPESDGIVERLNGSIERMLRCYVDHNQRDWDTKLSLVMSAYRSSVHASTCHTPYFLLHGNEYTLPVDLILRPKLQ